MFKNKYTIILLPNTCYMTMILYQDKKCLEFFYHKHVLGKRNLVGKLDNFQPLFHARFPIKSISHCTYGISRSSLIKIIHLYLEFWTAYDIEIQLNCLGSIGPHVRSNGPLSISIFPQKTIVISETQAKVLVCIYMFY